MTPVRNIKTLEALREMSEKYLGEAGSDEILGAQLDEAVRAGRSIFYYRTEYDARILFLKNLVENRGQASDETLKNDFVEKLKHFDLAAMINEVNISNFIVRFNFGLWLENWERRVSDWVDV